MLQYLIEEILNTKKLINSAKRDLSDFTEVRDAGVEQQLTDLEINQMEDEQVITDHDIAIMELRAAAE